MIRVLTILGASSHAEQVELQGAFPTRLVRVVGGGALLAIAATAVALSMLAIPAAAAVPPLGSSQVPQGEPRYTVAIKSIEAVDEWGWDYDHDDVFGVFDTNRGFTTATSVYRNMDTGDEVNLPRLEQCLAPQRILSGEVFRGLLWAPDDRWECDQRGVPAPIAVDLELWEDEICNPIFPWSCFDGYAGGPVDSADNLIGEAEWTYTPRYLASILDHVGENLTMKITLGGRCGHQDPNHVCGDVLATGPEYRVTVFIRRVNDAPLRATQE
jgi:hypothetical protein